MKSVLKALQKGHEPVENLIINEADCHALAELLAFVASLLENEKLYINRPGKQNQACWIALCQEYAHKFANIKVEREQ